MAKDDPSIAAVAGDIAAEQYDLMTMAKSIEDFANNTTRFLIIGNEEVAPSGSDKTSLIVEANNKPGALLKLLEPFQSSGVSLTRIDTRPSRTDTWSYVFFIEFEGHKDDDIIARILDGLGDHSRILKVLGSYPRAVL